MSKRAHPAHLDAPRYLGTGEGWRLKCPIHDYYFHLPGASPACKNGFTRINLLNTHMKEDHNCTCPGGDCLQQTHLSTEKKEYFMNPPRRSANETTGDQWARIHEASLPTAPWRLAPYMPTLDQFTAVTMDPSPLIIQQLEAQGVEDARGFLSHVKSLVEMVCCEGPRALSARTDPPVSAADAASWLVTEMKPEECVLCQQSEQPRAARGSGGDDDDNDNDGPRSVNQGRTS